MEQNMSVGFRHMHPSRGRRLDRYAWHEEEGEMIDCNDDVGFVVPV